MTLESLILDNTCTFNISCWNKKSLVHSYSQVVFIKTAKWSTASTNRNVGQCSLDLMAALSNIGGALCSMPQFGWRPLLECRAVTLPRRETRWNLQGCPKLAKRSQPLVGWSSPYYGDMWRRYCCLTSFFPIVDTCLSWEDIVRRSCTMVPRWRIFGDFLGPAFPASRCGRCGVLTGRRSGTGVKLSVTRN